MTRMTKQQEKDAVYHWENKMDNLLYDCLEITKNMPTKWGIDKNNNMCILYPVPTFNQDCTIKGIEYVPHKAMYLPDILSERLEILEDEIEAVNAPKKRKSRRLANV
jgi:hypothetical protein